MVHQMKRPTTEEQIIKLFKTLLKHKKTVILDVLQDIVDDDDNEGIDVEIIIDDDEEMPISKALKFGNMSDDDEMPY